MRVVTLGKSRQLTIVFLAVLVPAAATLVWLGLRLLEQDRILYAQRESGRLLTDVDWVVRTLSRQMSTVERHLLEGKPVAGAATFTQVAGGVSVEPRSMVAWVDDAPSLHEVPSSPFTQAELFESGENASRALAAYAAFTRSPARDVRAGALIRLAQFKARLGDVTGAIGDYRRLVDLDDMQADGIPVDLLARRALCELSPDGSIRDGLVQALETEFLAGRWALSRDAWNLVAGALTRWTKRPVSPTADQRALSAVTSEFLTIRPGTYGTGVILGPDGHVTMVYRMVNGSPRAMAIPESTLAAWLTSAARKTSLDPATLSLLGASGQSIVGARTRGVLVRLADATGLPWDVAVAPGTAVPVSTDFQSRQRLFGLGLGALGLLLAGGAFLLWRVVQREMAVARLQAEFVAAVSHEFRTPVTSLRHVIELLQEHDELPANKRASFYGVLSRSVERLHHLVESLLDFARMEEGRKPYNLQAIDPAVLVSDVVRDFQTDPASHGYEVAVTVDPGTPQEIQADAASVGHALWNLLDNAVKYSPSRHAVSVSLGPHRAGVAISVTDAGIGIPHDERREIFLKFVRGGQASRLGIKGTGVGLAIVEHIARAHNGSIELESVPGEGSTFRLVLPIPS